MRGILSLGVAIAGVMLAVGGCSSDSTPAAGAGDCKGDYAALNQSELGTHVDQSGKCTGDVATVCGNDVTVTAEECGADCYRTDAPDDTTQNACVKTCLNGGISPVLSTGCLDCYVADVGCARDHCLITCGAAPTSQNCFDCRVKNGCAPAFFSCSGLPDESAGTGAAGAGNESGSGGAASAELAGPAGSGGS